MRIIQVRSHTDTEGRLKVDVPTTIHNQSVQVIVIVQPTEPRTDRRYDFSGVVGRLKWTGDAVATQRAIRNEW
jgi:hypothetical protein